jgi:hypothetical protein
MNAKLKITRESKLIFVIKGDSPYWSDGSPISARTAFDRNGILSSIRAQSIDREAGNQYLLIAPISFKHSELLSTAGALQIGESAVVTL